MIVAILSLPVRLVAFTFWFSGQLMTSSAKVAADALSPGHEATPRVVRLALGMASDMHVTLISILITLTPGTLTLGVQRSADGARTILVHSMYHPDNESAVRDLRTMDDRLTASVRMRGRA